MNNTAPPTIYFHDEQTTLHLGDATAVLTRMDAGSVDCIVTSPPYYGLRDYGVDGQMGAEASPAEYVQGMVNLFREARRVLADDGTFWLNLGDAYQSKGGHTGQGANSQRKRRSNLAAQNAAKVVSGLPNKNLLGIPWRVAFALQDDGWILRNSIIWHKTNAMPESVTDRLSNRHENLFMFTKRGRYWFNLDAVREPHEFAIAGKKRQGDANTVTGPYKGPGATGENHMYGHELGKNPGDVWPIPTAQFPGAHFAAMPPALAERCIRAGCKSGGTVLDPFSGSGTTGMAAAKYGGKYVGIDINPDYLDLSLRTRLQQPGLDFASLTQADRETA